MRIEMEHETMERLIEAVASKDAEDVGFMHDEAQGCQPALWLQLLAEIETLIDEAI